MKIGILFFLFFPFLLSKSFAQDADRCKDIIPLGFYTKTNIGNSGNFTNDVKNWLLSENLKEYIRKSGGGLNLGIPIDGVPLNIGFNSNEGDYEKLKNHLSTQGTNYMNSSFANFIAQQVVDKSVVDAWSKCMSEYAPKQGLQFSIEGDKTGVFFNLIVYWVPRLNVNSCKLGKPFIVNADYDTSLFKNEMVIGTEPIRIPLLRKGNTNIFVTINALDGLGSLSITIPKEQPKPIEVDDECDCYKGNIEACKRYKNKILQQCQGNNSLECNNLVAGIESTIEYMIMISTNGMSMNTPQFKEIMAMNKNVGLFKKCN